jgi:hypothetical protein
MWAMKKNTMSSKVLMKSSALVAASLTQMHNLFGATTALCPFVSTSAACGAAQSKGTALASIVSARRASLIPSLTATRARCAETIVASFTDTNARIQPAREPFVKRASAFAASVATLCALCTCISCQPETRCKCA